MTESRSWWGKIHGRVIFVSDNMWYITGHLGRSSIDTTKQRFSSRSINVEEPNPRRQMMMMISLSLCISSCWISLHITCTGRMFNIGISEVVTDQSDYVFFRFRLPFEWLKIRKLYEQYSILLPLRTISTIFKWYSSISLDSENAIQIPIPNLIKNLMNVFYRHNWRVIWFVPV